MKIAIHQTKKGFDSRWISYCSQKEIPFKIVNCYSNNIIDELKDCDALMWHHYQSSPKDVLIAKPILYSLEQSGKIVFPDFFTNWHFDDKLGQKYLLESIGAPLVRSFVSFNRQEALKWAKEAEYPQVFKLRRGAGSSNVRLVRSYRDAKRKINKAFGSGFTNFDSFENLREAIRKRRLKLDGWLNVLKGLALLARQPRYDKALGREYGYVYFQEFRNENNFDIRVVIIGDRAFAIKRMVRKNDFRASGSGIMLYEKENFDLKTIQLAFDIAKKLHSQVIAFDFVYYRKEPMIIEMSYGFVKEGYDKCEGFWDVNLNWYNGSFDPCSWMVDAIVEKINERES
jgi:glutathione synthase/RimK-type ligase-like ATP-grasp enzyme